MVVLEIKDGIKSYQGQQLLAGYSNIQNGCRKIAIEFAKKYLHKNPKGIIDRYR